MKSNIVLSVFMVLLAVVHVRSTSAQSSFGSINMVKQDLFVNGTGYGESITRGLYPNRALTFQDHTLQTGTGRFVMNNGTIDCYQSLFINGVHITDFEQLDDQDIVVFCGYRYPHSTYNQFCNGVLGWFKPSTTAQVDYFYAEFDSIEKFTSVAGYYYNGQPNLVAKGIHRESGEWRGDVVCIENFLFAQSTQPYTRYRLPMNQSLIDIVKTENYIVFYGYSGNNRLCLRRETYAGMSNGTLLNDLYVYSTQCDPAHYTFATYLGNTLDRNGDRLAVGGPFLLSNGTTLEARCYTFDASTMNMTHVQKFALPGKQPTYGMTYVSDGNMIGLLQAGHPIDGSFVTSVVMLDPYPAASYLANFFIDPTAYYYSIDKLNYVLTNDKHFLLGTVITGGFRWSLRSTLCGGMTTPCNENQKLPIDILPTVQKTLLQSPYPRTSSTIQVLVEHSTCQQVIPDIIDCVY